VIRRTLVAVGLLLATAAAGCPRKPEKAKEAPVEIDWPDAGGAEPTVR
jgi:hypothetical protein